MAEDLEGNKGSVFVVENYSSPNTPGVHLPQFENHCFKPMGLYFFTFLKQFYNFKRCKHKKKYFVGMLNGTDAYFCQ